MSLARPESLPPPLPLQQDAMRQQEWKIDKLTKENRALELANTELRKQVQDVKSENLEVRAKCRGERVAWAQTTEGAGGCYPPVRVVSFLALQPQQAAISSAQALCTVTRADPVALLLHTHRSQRRLCCWTMRCASCVLVRPTLMRALSC